MFFVIFNLFFCPGFHNGPMKTAFHCPTPWSQQLLLVEYVHICPFTWVHWTFSFPAHLDTLTIRRGVFLPIGSSIHPSLPQDLGSALFKPLHSHGHLMSSSCPSLSRGSDGVALHPGLSSPGWIRLFNLQKVINLIAGRPKLPRSMHINPTFNASKLKPVHDSPPVTSGTTSSTTWLMVVLNILLHPMRERTPVLGHWVALWAKGKVLGSGSLHHQLGPHH